jgi:protein TonB
MQKSFYFLKIVSILRKIVQMRFVFSLLLLLLSDILFAQNNTPPPMAINDTAIIFTKTEVEASVDRQEWIDHLTKNLQSPIEKAARKGMKAGTYTVQVKFLVERDGSISDVHALNDPGYGLAVAAEKALQTGPKWKPGTQNGKVVRSYHTQPITFVIQEK